MWPNLMMQLGIGDVDAAAGGASGDGGTNDGSAGTGGHGGAGGAAGNPIGGQPDGGCSCSAGGSLAIGAGLMLGLAVLGAVLGRRRL
jgi:hypothetical protein